MGNVRLLQGAGLVGQVCVEAAAPPSSEEAILAAWVGGVSDTRLPARANPALLTQPSLASSSSHLCLPDGNVLVISA